MHNLLHNEKDIDSIFFYAINGNIDHLTLFYTANNIKYKIDYKDVNFKETVDRIIKVYNILKDEKNINLIGDLTKDILEGKINIDNKVYNKTLIDTNNLEYNIMFSYNKLIIENTLKALEIKEKVYFTNKYVCYVKCENENKINYIPLIFYKTTNGYKLKYKIEKNKKEYIFDADINIYNKSIIVSIKNNEYIAEIIFDRLNINNSIVFKNKKNNIIYSNYFENDLLNDDIEKIKNVFKLIDLDYEINGIKTIDNNYILYNNKDDYEYYMHLNIDDYIIRINLKQLKKYKKDKIDFKVDEEHFEYLIINYNKNHILIQQKYLLSDNSNFLYKKSINKSRYYLLNTSDYIKFKDAKILNREEINTNLENIEDIKKLILKKD